MPDEVAVVPAAVYPVELQDRLFDDMASMEVTYNRQQGRMDPVTFDLSDEALKDMAREALRQGLPGLDPQPNPDLKDYVVDRFAAKDGLPNRISLRPKTPFGQVFGSLEELLSNLSSQVPHPMSMGKVIVITDQAPAIDETVSPKDKPDNSPIAVGDIVYLKSGSPQLTVIEVEERVIRVNWFDDMTMRYGSFAPVCLTKRCPDHD